MSYFSTVEKFRSYLSDIRNAREAYAKQGVKVLIGLEVEIDSDGNFGLADGIRSIVGTDRNLSKYVDYVIGVIHSECFTETLTKANMNTTDPASASLLLKNIANLIANPYIDVWGHPSQVVHGQFTRDYTASERAVIIECLQKRKAPLPLEYNLNPYPRYEDWGTTTSAYVSDHLLPNDLELLKAYGQIGGKFVISTDAHDIEQTSRLNSTTLVPNFIKNHIIYL